LSSAEESNKLYRSWIAELEENSRATRGIMQGEQPVKYKECYDMWMKSYEKIFSGGFLQMSMLWMDANKEIYGKYASSMEPTGEIFEHFVKSSDIFLSMYKSWIAALEKMSEKAKEMSKQSSDPEGYKEFYNLWVMTYEKAFDGFFDDMPTIGGPMKEIMEPVKAMAKMYADTFTRMSKMWVKSNVRSASAYPGKYTT
ncbi:MAG TPA: hypothetical protein VIO58_03515, partial [Candidatus Methanoperedens sp.]